MLDWQGCEVCTYRRYLHDKWNRNHEALMADLRSFVSSPKTKFWSALVLGLVALAVAADFIDRLLGISGAP